MPNMSYCMFENTSRDLRDCYDAEGMFEPEVLSAGERKARERLIKLCRQIVNELSGEDDQ